NGRRMLDTPIAMPATAQATAQVRPMPSAPRRRFRAFTQRDAGVGELLSRGGAEARRGCERCFCTLLPAELARILLGSAEEFWLLGASGESQGTDRRGAAGEGE